MLAGRIWTRFIAIVLFAVCFTVSVKVKAGALVLALPLANELNSVLNVTSSLHQSLVLQDEEQIDLGLRDMIWHLERARVASNFAKEHERRHLLIILDSAREHFELTQTSFGEERRAQLERGFNQIVNLVRIYKLDRKFGIFFCPRDRTSWVQKGWKAQNPFRPDSLRTCGMRVPN